VGVVTMSPGRVGGLVFEWPLVVLSIGGGD